MADVMSLSTAHSGEPTLGAPHDEIEPGLLATLVRENADLAAELRARTSELRRTRAEIALTAATERHRLERELHDGAQNRLVALQIRLTIAQERADDDAPAIAALLRRISEDAEALGAELRRIAWGVYPPVLATHGLAEALRSEAHASAVAVRVVAEDVGPSRRGIEVAVYLCCLEAMQNAAKHAGRGIEVTVSLRQHGDMLMFNVSDDGCGFDAAATDGSGLAGMRERIGSLGGRLDVASVRGRGTTVAGVVPWPVRPAGTDGQ
jgi:signal transduction histidine kinase